MIGRLIFVAALLSAPATWGQETAAPATPDQIAAARAHADAVLDRATARPLFVNVTTSAVPQVRHVASGLTCSFNVGDARDVINFYTEARDALPKGDDVGCGSWRATTYVSLFATRYPGTPSADQLFSDAVQNIQQAWQNVVQTEFQVATAGGQPEPLVAVFTAERNGTARTTMVLLRNIGAWSFKARVTGAITDPETPVRGALAFTEALPGVVKATEP